MEGADRDRQTDNSYRGEGLREGDADTGLLHLLLELLDAVLAVVVVSGDGAHPGPAKVQHQLGHGRGLVLVVGDGPQEGGELELTLQGRTGREVADLQDGQRGY